MSRLAGGMLLWAALLPGLAQAGVLASRPAPIQAGDGLSVRQGEFVLGRAFADIYDTAFVLNTPGVSTPRVVTIDELADALQPYDVVFFGEIHGHPGIHLQQLRLLRALHERDPRLVLSLEQFERDVQGVVDDYLARRIGERTLIDRGRAWENYPGSYRPLVLYSRDQGLPVIAAEAPTWSVSCIGQLGTEILDQFTPLERGWVAKDLHVTTGAYRDSFLSFTQDNPSHGNAGAGADEAQRRSERAFAAQVARDDTMAESIVLARLKYPGRRVLHLNGSFHSARFLGTVERLRLRDPELRIAVIDPVEVGDASAPAFSTRQLGEGTVLQLIYPSPPQFAEGEDQDVWVRSLMAKRKANICKYHLPVVDGAKGDASGTVAAPATTAPAAP